MNFIVTIADPSFRKSKKVNVTAAPQGDVSSNSSVDLHICRNSIYKIYRVPSPRGISCNSSNYQFLLWLAGENCVSWKRQLSMLGRWWSLPDGGHRGCSPAWTWTNPPLLLAGLLPLSLRPPHRLSLSRWVTSRQGAASTLFPRSHSIASQVFLSNLPNSPYLYHVTKMKKDASSIQQQRRGSSYCGSPIRHLWSFYASTH